MSSLTKIINVRQLEADLLADSPLSEDVDWASDDSSNPPELEEVENDSPSALPKLEMSTEEAVLGDLSPTPNEEETVRIRWNPLSGVSCPQNADPVPILSSQSPASVSQTQGEEAEREALAAAVGVQRTLKKGNGRQKGGKKKSRRQQRSSACGSAAAPSRSAGHRYMEDWMPSRDGQKKLWSTWTASSAREK